MIIVLRDIFSYFFNHRQKNKISGIKYLYTHELFDYLYIIFDKYKYKYVENDQFYKKISKIDNSGYFAKKDLPKGTIIEHFVPANDADFIYPKNFSYDEIIKSFDQYVKTGNNLYKQKNNLASCSVFPIESLFKNTYITTKKIKKDEELCKRYDLKLWGCMLFWNIFGIDLYKDSVIIGSPNYVFETKNMYNDATKIFDIDVGNRGENCKDITDEFYGQDKKIINRLQGFIEKYGSTEIKKNLLNLQMALEKHNIKLNFIHYKLDSL